MMTARTLISLTPAQHRALHDHARATGQSAAEVIRGALAAMGIDGTDPREAAIRAHWPLTGDGWELVRVADHHERLGFASGAGLARTLAGIYGDHARVAPGVWRLPAPAGRIPTVATPSDRP